ncbi:MAG TPA: 4Fe-4S dicluster domain-containing protein [Smithellaceae bacterium]|nr:4Fe-4S dicluster domain-containing protein [Smithellaceae bacterium]
MIWVRIRQVFSILVFLLFALLFLLPERFIHSGLHGLVAFQFVPALIRTLSEPEALFAAGVVFVLLITLCFGRVYCSFLCPLGTLQDILSRLSARMGARRTYRYRPPRNILRYGLLAITAISASAGAMTLIAALDPFSLTGRLFKHLVHPPLAWVYNTATGLLKPFDIYRHPLDTAFVPLSVAVFTGLFLAGVAYLAARHGRLYCNTLCPVGAFLGLLGRLSLFRLRLNPSGCRECARCEDVCKAGCLDARSASIDESRCVRCFNCLQACSKNTIRFRPVRRPGAGPVWSPSRRALIASLAAALTTGTAAISFSLRQPLAAATTPKTLPVTPPGSTGFAAFTHLCTACSLCISVCPTKVLTPSFMDYGPAGFLQPKMNYEKSFCDFECTLCGRVCPTGAIGNLAPEDKKLTKIGEAKLLDDLCVVYVDHNNCGACGEVCPTGAIRFVEKETILYPEVDAKFCIGCGACELVCPTRPRSIVVDALAVHTRAEKNISPPTPKRPGGLPDEGFPF